MRLLALMLIGGLAAAAAGMAGPKTKAGAVLATSATDVIARNVAARGGAAAWERVETMVWLGHLERESKDAERIPFVMQLRRPNLTRFELKEQFNQFTRIFDGTHGWKVRPSSDGRPETKPFSPEETNYAAKEFVIDGPLIDYQAKGVTADLDGLDSLEGRKTYRLSLRLPSGAERKVWIDTATNLEVRYDRPATNPLRPGAPVSVYYRHYEAIDGLLVARSIETGVAATGDAGMQRSEKLVIDRVLINPKLDDGTFAPPPMTLRRGGHVRIPGS